MRTGQTSARLAEEARQFYWYHCVDLGQGVLTDGDYDIRPLLDHFHFPSRMEHLRVLDVGRASGFFAFEFESRGAEVTATELPSFLDWDFVGGQQRKDAVRRTLEDEAAFTRRHITGAFEFAHRVRQSRVRSKSVNIYQLRPELFDHHLFDVVFAGAVTSHLRDPILALERLHSVTRGVCILAVPTVNLPGCEDRPVMQLVGTTDSDRRSWWTINERAIVEMMRCANFTNVKIVSRYDLVNRRVKDMVIPHVVVHGRAA